MLAGPFFPAQRPSCSARFAKGKKQHTNANAYAVYMIIHCSDMSLYIYIDIFFIYYIYIHMCVYCIHMCIYITGNCKNMNSINKKKQIVQNNVRPSQTCVICSSRTCSIDRRICAVRCSRACQHHPRHLNRKID